MAIILEGPDLGGKSTVAKIISNITGLKVFHFGGPPKSKREIFDRIKNAPKNVIFDRHPCISERIYGSLSGREPMISEDYALAYLKELNPLIFYCNPGLEYLKTKLQFLKTKPHKKIEHINSVRLEYNMIYIQYETFIHRLNNDLKVININFITITQTQLKEAINEYNRHKR